MSLAGALLAFILANPLPREQPPAVSPAAGTIVTLPKTLSASAGDLVIVKAESGAELVTWDASDGLTLTIPKPYDPAMKSIAVHAKENGTYALTASIPSGKETRVAICLVTIGPRPPPPPPPAPTFESRLQDAFTADQGTPAQAALLAALYRKSVVKKTALTAPGPVYDLAIVTVGALVSEIQVAVKHLGLPSGSLAKTVRVIAAELDNALPTSPATPLTDGSRDRIAAAFLRVADALEKMEVK